MHSGSQKGLRDCKYGQLCQSLLDLELAAETIFNTVSNRVVFEHQRLESVKGRIRKVQNQIRSITGTSRAITVYSSSKYPTIPVSQQDFIPVFGARVGESYSEFPLATIFLSSGQSQNGGDGTFELYRFFAETSCESWLSAPKQKGIGSLPTNLNSIVDAFLFNTTELPYSKYQIVDNLLSSGNFPLQGQSSECIILPPPPQSILDCSNKNAGLEDFGFRPVLGQVPSFTLPPVLPDLPNVAEINWSGWDSGIESLASIAPSAPLKLSARDVSSSSKDSQRAALLASICNPNITLRKIGEIEEKNETLQPGNSTTDANQSSQRQSGNLLSEMANALKLRRLSMQGAAYNKEQGGIQSSGMFNTVRHAAVSSSSNFSSKVAFPVANVYPHVMKSDESNTEDEWDDQSSRHAFS